MDQTYNLDTWFPFPPLGQPDAPVQLASSTDVSYVDGSAQYGSTPGLDGLSAAGSVGPAGPAGAVPYGMGGAQSWWQ